jgi:hypothetical protein
MSGNRRSLAALAIALALAASTAVAARPELGTNCPRLHGYQFFSPDHPWNKDISNDPVDPASASIIAFYGGSSQLIYCDFGPGHGIPYSVVSGTQRKIRVLMDSTGEADCPMMPIPPTAPIEGGGDAPGGDSHCLVLDRDNGIVYETFITRRMSGGKYFAVGFGCIFNMNTSVLRPFPWSSADAAGLSILAGLVRGDEVIDDGVVNHPIRFVVENSKMAFVAPATHKASPFTGPNYLPIGARMRL